MHSSFENTIYKDHKKKIMWIMWIFFKNVHIL